MRAIVIGTHLERGKRADLRQSGSGPASESRRWSGFKHLQKWLGGLAIITAVIAPVQAQTVTLGWAASPGPNLAGYKLCYGSISGIYTNQTDVGNVTSKTVSGLKNGVTYYFATQENLETFKKSPAKYEPAYGGWCAYTVALNGDRVKVDPTLYKISDGKLYLFYNFNGENRKLKWERDERKLKVAADKHWREKMH